MKHAIKGHFSPIITHKDSNSETEYAPNSKLCTLSVNLSGAWATFLFLFPTTADLPGMQELQLCD